MSDHPLTTPEECYAELVGALRSLRSLRSPEGGEVRCIDSSGLINVLPDPGSESEADRVLLFIEVVCGNLEYWYWAAVPGCEPLCVVAKKGLEPYGGLCAFASLVARQSDLRFRSMPAEADHE
jgi:hypothetical protein